MAMNETNEAVRTITKVRRLSRYDGDTKEAVSETISLFQFIARCIANEKPSGSSSNACAE